MTIARPLLGVVVIFVGCIVLGMFYYCRRELEIVGKFIKYAGICLRSNPSAYLIILVNLLVFAVVIGLFVFQYLSFYSMGFPAFSVHSPYYNLKSTWKSGILQTFNIISLLWGLNFTR